MKEDVGIVYDLIREDPDRGLYIGGNFNLTREEFINFLLSTDYGTKSLPTLIEAKNKIVGIAIINNISIFNLSAQFRILAVKKEYRKFGYGVYAAMILGAFLFGELKLNKVYTGKWDHNPNMDEIYKSAGLKLEGIDRENVRINGKWIDRQRWGLLRGEISEKLEKIFQRIMNENKIT